MYVPLCIFSCQLLWFIIFFYIVFKYIDFIFKKSKNFIPDQNTQIIWFSKFKKSQKIKNKIDLSLTCLVGFELSFIEFENRLKI